MKNSKNIILCGFMGSGKTTVGTALSELICKDFIDLDKYIERKCKKTVAEIFKTKGEAHFRKLEERFTKRLARRKNLVLSLGGGTVLNPKNVEVLKKNGVFFYLKVDANTVINRLSGDKTRPLLLENAKENTVSLLEKREPIYSHAADFTVDGNLSINETVNQILDTYFSEESYK